jgi:hypothetical protein
MTSATPGIDVALVREGSQALPVVEICLRITRDDNPYRVL